MMEPGDTVDLHVVRRGTFRATIVDRAETIGWMGSRTDLVLCSFNDGEGPVSLWIPVSSPSLLPVSRLAA